MKNNSNRSKKKEQNNGGYEIYERIKFVADKRKKTLSEVATDSGFKSPNAIYNYKRGVMPSSAGLTSIAAVLSTSKEYLKGETDDWDELQADKKEYIADLNSPVFALNGQKITGELAKDIRDYAEFKLNQAKKDN